MKNFGNYIRDLSTKVHIWLAALFVTFMMQLVPGASSFIMTGRLSGLVAGIVIWFILAILSIIFFLILLLLSYGIHRIRGKKAK